MAYRRDVDRAQVAKTRQTLERQIRASLRRAPTDINEEARRGQLRDRAAELRIVESLQDGDVEVVERADVPTEAISPKPHRDTAIGVALGLLLGVGLALPFEALDRRLRSMRSVETTFERPILGAIPESRALSKESRVVLPPGEQEAFRMSRQPALLPRGRRPGVGARDVRGTG